MGYTTIRTEPKGAFAKDCTGDVVAGDDILWTEGVFGGSYRKPKFLGVRRIAGRVLADSYGAGRQQHTLTIEVLWSDGEAPEDEGAKIRRKGRNIYRNGTYRTPWEDESLRNAAAAEKHARGDEARAARDLRRRECLGCGATVDAHATDCVCGEPVRGAMRC